MSNLPLIDNCLFLDNSTIERITTCPTAADYYYNQKRELVSSAASLRYGRIIHEAIAYRLHNQHAFDEDKQLELVTSLFNAEPCEVEGWRNLDSASKLLRAYNRLTFLERYDIIKVRHSAPQCCKQKTVVIMSGQDSGVENLIWVCNKCHKHYKTAVNEPLIEKPFACYIGTVRGIKVIYTGRLDLALIDDGNLWVRDVKTTSLLGDGFWQDLAMSEQLRGYCWALREAIGIEPVGYIIEALCTRESITNAYFDEVMGTVRPIKPNGKSVPVEFGRQRFFTKEPPGQLDEWRDNLLLQIDAFLGYAESGKYPRHHKHCVGKYGLCPYYRVCELPAKSRQTALDSGAYQDVKWTPLEAPKP